MPAEKCRASNFPLPLVPTGIWTEKMNTLQPYCLGQVAFTLCRDQGDLVTLYIYSCIMFSALRSFY